ncbi:LysR family transcriptional regulator [Aestuariivita boseongensis]|uniref:LysR family transcriptional regulator n=1 Tax=Aestuariivita boseongensis TaxID=1470562 RepID=UPI000681D09C|nr:LysR family transcriptional regulator [Aestuariivita boseongensis]
MDNSAPFTDWSHVQSFLAVAETGSLSAAAQRLGQSQPTIGRHVKALEDGLGVELFHRHARGLVLTDIGAEMRPAAEAMRAAMATIALQAEAHSDTSSGTVRIASSDFMAHHVLPRMLAEIRREHPMIQLVVVPSDSSENLLFRQADIAIRMYRPDQLELVTRHVADIELGTFAARSYLERRGRPETAEDLLDHDLVGYDRSTLIVDTMHELGWPGGPESFAVRCDHHPTYWEMVRAGCGIGFTQARVGRADPLVEELHLDLPIPPLEIWLTAHQTVRKAPRVDAIWRALDKRLTAEFA